jgi:hypothetical protein
MSTPDRPDDAHIADTSMFRRFVDSESTNDRQADSTSRTRLWLWIGAVVIVVVVALVIWLLAR